MAGFAIRRRFAGHPGRSTKSRHELRLKPDHSVGAGHFRKVPQPKQARADAMEEEQRAALQRIRDSVKRTPADWGLAGG
ncbi:hypothetical protein SAMN05660710_03589 [Paracoccus tibetensis]|uniref:Uncharacterized protein n=1 Tax=Paracoccus tibetensis TaxID=336292 RepID=A0A1G5K080_9RHOB|nr:hypothetical protein SAMN05660710_03589 [Paracoccus tibetensis]